jgi:dTDP-4-dehydrorhamnose reductase
VKHLGLVIGAAGMLGTDIVRNFRKLGYTVLSPTRREMDISNARSLVKFITEYRPHWVINCAAKHDLEFCEKDLNTAMEINAHAVNTLAQTCAKLNSYLIHISTDYVFDGTKEQPYLETDEPNPLNNYGVTKLMGENFVLEKNKNALILRVAALFGSSISRDKGLHCFVDRMRQKLIMGEILTVNKQQNMSPTSTIEIANQLISLVREQPTGIMHCVNNGFTNYYDLTYQIARYLNFTPSRISTQIIQGETINLVPRPLNSALVNRRLNELNLNAMQDWEIALHEYLKANTF